VDPDQIDEAIAIATTEAEPVTRALPFKVFTGILKASRGADGKRRLFGVASSTTKDLHGDNMLETALEDMEQQANQNLTIFLNHSYSVPEDVAGSVEKAKMTPRGVDGEGNPNYDLDFQVVINEKNPRAVDAWEAIDGGTKLGLSIGALIPEGGAMRNKKSGALSIAHVLLLETSIVGIPANPRSWIDAAVKAFVDSGAKTASQTIPLGTPTLTLDGKRYRIEGDIEGLNVTASSITELTAELNTKTVLVHEDGTEEILVPDAGSPEPDAEKARVRIIEVDTDEPSSDDSSPSQGADDSGPDDEGDYAAPEPSVVAEGDATHGDPAPTATAALDPLVMSNVEGVLKLLETTTSQLVATREALTRETQAREAAERERDTIATNAGELMSQVKQVIEVIADTPIGKKSGFRQAQADFGHLEGLYSESFLRLLRS
jgi:hypothetical protein